VKSPLHRDDPSKEPLAGNVKVTKQDWLNVAIDTLVSDGIEQVKVMTLAENLSVSRSSFYWYFKSRQDLLDNLLDHWLALNTDAIVAHAGFPANTVTAATCNLFSCFIDPALFDTKLDFAIRDWARRSGKVRRVLDTSDTRRITAIAGMFARFDYSEIESLTRAKVLYYMQIGYNDADLQETLEERQAMLPHYLFAFTGRKATQEEMAVVHANMRRLRGLV
jgi:AcrR family transcriptional regulator